MKSWRISHYSYSLFKLASGSSLSKRPLFSTQVSSKTSGVRINRCFPQHSRKEVDSLIAAGQRILLNGRPAALGMRLQSGDVLEFDGKELEWTTYFEATQQLPLVSAANTHVYLKYWKPEGVTCTTSINDKTNIVKSLAASPKWTSYHQQQQSPAVYSVGRLDKQSEGLILVTSDRRLLNWLLGARTGGTKVYQVELSRPPSSEALQRWAAGVPITTRTTNGKIISNVKTLPCEVVTLNGTGGTEINNKSGSLDKQSMVQFTLREGRNRQIRRMAHALGYHVRSLLRTGFCGIGLDGLKQAGDFAPLTAAELAHLSKYSNLASPQQ